MRNVIPINPKARQIRDAMLCENVVAVTVAYRPKMPYGYWDQLQAYTETWLYTKLDAPPARMLVSTAEGGQGYVDLRTA